MKKNPLLTFIIAVVVILLLIPVTYYTSAETIQITVTGNERINTPKGGYYLVYTEHETFKNVDTFWYFKWNSSDVQGKLRPNNTVSYVVKVNGIRIPFFSMYRNIISVKQVVPLQPLAQH